MEDQKQTEVKALTPEEELKQTKAALEGLTFLTDNVKFNSVMYSGFRLILEKLTKIEEMLKPKV